MKKERERERYQNYLEFKRQVRSTKIHLLKMEKNIKIFLLLLLRDSKRGLKLKLSKEVTKTLNP
jgi:hypothetical protein